jgi:3-carboxy-cis,cis-muconate cycloisomerase
MPQKRNPIACEYVLAQARGVHALVPQMLAAMAQDLERGTGPWQAELLALPQAVVLAHGATCQARFIAEGLVVDAARMRRNIDATRGLIVSEAVMMGLAPVFGRGEAHHIVNDACDLAIAQDIGLTEALLRDARVSAKLDAGAIGRMTDPSAYLGSAGAFTDRVLARARSAGLS